MASAEGAFIILGVERASQLGELISIANRRLERDMPWKALADLSRINDERIINPNLWPRH
jgi:hypothetical protein